jgi:TRAP-type mannitol/chloroaromatic compound transport system substrate-binding protein
MSESREERYTPLLILLLVAALVAVVALWATDKAGSGPAGKVSGTAVSGRSEAQFHWKIITTWPKNFPGLGTAAENFSRMVDEMSNGRLTARVYGAGELVPAFEVFDALA